MTGNTDQDFAAATHALLDAHGDLMLSLVKRSILHTLDSGGVMDVDLSTLPAELNEVGACFVTLNIGRQLRGCIGSPHAHRPLGLDLVHNANGSAFHDPRFAPLRRDEAERLDIHISVLSPAYPFDFVDEADMLAKLNPGEDGLIIEDLGRRALFLPSVWEQLPEPAAFAQHLKAKAGLPANHWSDTFTAKRFIAAQCGAHWTDID